MERRKYQRYKLAHKVKYSPLSTNPESSDQGNTQTEDVSRGGVRIRCKNAMDVGKVVNLKIYNSSHKKPIDADARVVWCRKESGDSAVMGLNFTRIGWVESDKLFKPEVIEG